ncbi:hypothetical protein NDU88_006593 [Pleurodeles waltl]|uniref:Uncharacterized protein n=1 Tax=Pleurodeles waltl TaxID=8319 RepID=A0AAV7MCP0_PLEWA|nr:hypothetical protein NDU88_006593 [Pleurodeles waltl]
MLFRLAMSAHLLTYNTWYLAAVLQHSMYPKRVKKSTASPKPVPRKPPLAGELHAGELRIEAAGATCVDGGESREDVKKEGEKKQGPGPERGQEPSADRHPGEQAGPRRGASSPERQRAGGDVTPALEPRRCKQHLGGRHLCKGWGTLRTSRGGGGSRTRWSQQQVQLLTL